MDATTFIFLHNTTNSGNINRESRININYDNNGDGTGTLKGITATVKTKADWSLPLATNNEVDLENVLLTVTSIRLTVDGELFSLPIVNRSRYTNVFNNINSDYYYFEITPTVFNITSTITNALPQITSITFLPFIQNEKYEYSDNNPLISNALSNRESTYIQQSDRIKSNTRPTNLGEILVREATPAQVQDSNYTSTGWSRARYVGSSTNALEYKGVPAAITARLFTGETNPSSSADLLICSRSISDRILTEMLFTGDQEVPTFEGFANTRYEIENPVSISSNVLPYIFSTTIVTGSLEIGSIIRVVTDPVNTELLRVEKIEPDLNRLQVTRGYLGTTKTDDIVAQDVIQVLKPLRIFKIDNVSAKVVNTTNAKIWVKESKEILMTDEYGMVYTSSNTCTV
jgi:hypothetical protein